MTRGRARISQLGETAYTDEGCLLYIRFARAAEGQSNARSLNMKIRAELAHAHRDETGRGECAHGDLVVPPQG